MAPAPVEDGVGGRGARRRGAGGTRPPARVGELQAHQQVVGAAERLGVGVDERGPQVGQRRPRPRDDGELVGVGAGRRLHRHRFATPDELGAAGPEAGPPPMHQVGGQSLGGAVPPLHGQDAPPVAHGQRARGTVGHGQRLGERAAHLDGVVDGEVDAQVIGTGPQVGRGRQPLHLHDVGRVVGHGCASRSAAIRASTSRSESGRVGAPSGTVGEEIQPRWWRNRAASWR